MDINHLKHHIENVDLLTFLEQDKKILEVFNHSNLKEFYAYSVSFTPEILLVPFLSKKKFR